MRAFFFLDYLKLKCENFSSKVHLLSQNILFSDISTKDIETPKFLTLCTYFLFIGANINNSLMILGQVISKLSEGAKEHIPFRNSKLTRILKNSLGGNTKTAIMCCVTPAEEV